MKKSLFTLIVFSLLFSIECCVFLFLGIHIEKIQNEILMLIIAFLLSFILSLIFQKFYMLNNKKKKAVFFLTVPVVVIMIFACLWGFCKIDYTIWENHDNNQERQIIDSGKELMFADKKVMVFVPHQDDDILLMGGVFEQYIKNGSDIKVVFSSSSDQGVSDSGLNSGKELATERVKEAIKVLNSYGIPEDSIIFLGFGDGYSGKHLYNYHDAPNSVVKSRSDSDVSYASESHPAYKEGENLTKNNFNDDIKELMLSFRPDVVFCTDYDSHPDHRAISLSVEEVLGEILKSEKTFKPIVYKGFSYSTALKSTDDYYSSINPLATIKPYDTDYMNESNVYLWNERVRFPVSVNTLTHYYTNSKTSKSLDLYKTQHGTLAFRTKAVINSDKVFWERRTDSLLYDADISASSGNKKVITDYKLYDCDDINTEKSDFSKTAGVWIPERNDKEKRIKIELDKPQSIKSILLYDNPSINDNIINAEIKFNDGTKIETGELKRNGSATEIVMNKKEVSSFEIIVLSSEGHRAGLCEVEAYASENYHDTGFIKLKDKNENFVYDYVLENKDEAEFSLYKYGYDKEFNNENYTVKVSNKDVKARIKNEKLVIECPKDKEAYITIKSADGKESDTIKISNPHSISFMNWGTKITEYYNNNLVPTKQVDYFKRLLEGIHDIIGKIF